MYGISKKEASTLFSLLTKHKSSITEVRLFGSRARGDYKKNSDFDLAVSFCKPAKNDIIADFECSDFPYTVDILDYNIIRNKKLQAHIKRDEKIIFYVKEGKIMITSEQIKYKWEDYSRALDRLCEALKKDTSLDDMYVDATIQRFEFTFELGWKLLKAVLEYDGIEANSPRGSIREGFKADLIENADKWLNMLEKRNLSTHTYDEETALEIYNAVKNECFSLLVKFRDDMKARFFEQ